MTSATYQSPCGRLTLFATAEGITEIDFPAVRLSTDFLYSGRSEGCPHSLSANRSKGHSSLILLSTSLSDATAILNLAICELEEYFHRRRQGFTVPISLVGTPFQLEVWRALSVVPYGKTVTYGDLAVAIGHPKAFRAVGMACHANPVPILLPCHRIVGKGGALTGYSAGLDVKRRLLTLESSDEN